MAVTITVAITVPIMVTITVAVAPITASHGTTKIVCDSSLIIVVHDHGPGRDPDRGPDHDHGHGRVYYSPSQHDKNRLRFCRYCDVITMIMIIAST